MELYGTKENGERKIAETISERRKDAERRFAQKGVTFTWQSAKVALSQGKE